jgi:hypothetical protein
VVDDEEALGWKNIVEDYVAANPTIPGWLVLSAFEFVACYVCLLY